MKRILLLSVLLLFAAGLAFSLDFGVLLDQKFDIDNKLFSYSPTLTPWFSWTGSNGLSVYLSANVWLEYIKYRSESAGDSGLTKPVIKPEITRFALSYRNKNIFFEAGRVGYSDAIGFAASGLFDGLRFEAAFPAGTISAGAFYTGLLYKESAKIMMTDNDIQIFSEEWKWGSLSEYFAPRRLLASLAWDMPLGEANTLSIEALAQFDLSGSEPALHSQYGEIKMDFIPRDNLGISAGLLFEAMENAGSFSAAFGFLGRLWYDLPGSLSDRLSATVKFTSGAWNDTFALFTPISSVTQGSIFPGTNSGLASLSVDYNARLHRTLVADIGIRYFMNTYNDPSAEGSLHGGEIWASVAWQPLDDIRVTLGGGAFFPQLGNSYPDDTGVMWKISAGLLLSF